jgi:hypothetical protein
MSNVENLEYLKIIIYFQILYMELFWNVENIDMATENV